MTIQEARNVIALLQAIYPDRFRSLSDEGLIMTVKLWQQHFEDEPGELVWNAVNAFISTSTDSFAPNIGMIKEQIRKLTTPEQIHGDNIVRVGEGEAGRGRLSYADAIPATDTLMTDVPGVPLMLCFADCTPILLFDPVHRAAAIAHGGWKGTVRSIAAKTVRAMEEAYGTRPEDCLAGIGPAIGPCCYEVGDEVAEEFRKAFPQFAEEIISETGGKIRLDLWQANRLQLRAAGLLPGHIDAAGVCTSCHADTFFSYRAEGPTIGRIAAVMAIK